MSEENMWPEDFLDEMSPRVREKLLALAQSFHFKPDEVIFQEGSASPYVLLVKTGRVSVDIHVPSKGRRRILTAGQGEVVSWSALAQPCVHHASARAIEETELLGFPGEVLSAVCAEDYQTGYELYRALAGIASTRLTATRLQALDVFANP